jgi:hypothetical protein
LSKKENDLYQPIVESIYYLIALMQKQQKQLASLSLQLKMDCRQLKQLSYQNMSSNSKILSPVTLSYRL